MVPICKQQGCQVHRSGTTERAKCERQCALAESTSGRRWTPRVAPAPKVKPAVVKPAVVKQPKREPVKKSSPSERRKHLGTGKQVTRKEIPPWRGRPPGAGPWERTACGIYVETTVSLEEVTCTVCLRSADADT